MFRKIAEVVLVSLMLLASFTFGYAVGKPPVTKQEIIDTTDSLQSAMLEALEATKDK